MLRLLTCGRNYQWSKLHYEEGTNSVGGDPHSCSLSFNNPNTIINNIPDNQIVSRIQIRVLIDIV